MECTGGCYCGELRYKVSGDVLNKAMCFCRECQHIAGGGPNVAMLVAESSFSYTQGEPRVFARSDLATPAKREFCPTCGTHVVTRPSRAPGFVVVKVGSLDDPKVYGMPNVAAYTSERQVYHCIPDGVTQFEKFSARG